MDRALSRVRQPTSARKAQSFLASLRSFANRGYRSAKSALANRALRLASGHHVQLTNSKCFVYASLMVDRLQSAVMSFNDYPRTDRQGTSHVKWMQCRAEAFAG